MKTQNITNGYFLAEACKNTFLLFDCLHLSVLDDNFLKSAHKSLLKEQKDDAMILVDGHEKNGEFYARMVVLGQDGELGEFCGNGSRACAAYLFNKYKNLKKFYLITAQGDRPLFKHEPEIYSIKMPLVRFELNSKFIAMPELFKKESTFYVLALDGKKFYYAEAIEPHLVLREDITDEELFQLGKKLNQLKNIFPLGINLNRCKLIDKNTLQVTTYERGVQRLTLSCGTGSSSCASIYLANKPGKVKVITPGGPLDIEIEKDCLQLKGPATVDFSIVNAS